MKLHLPKALLAALLLPMAAANAEVSYTKASVVDTVATTLNINFVKGSGQTTTNQSGEVTINGINTTWNDWQNISIGQDTPSSRTYLTSTGTVTQNAEEAVYLLETSQRGTWEGRNTVNGLAGSLTHDYLDENGTSPVSITLSVVDGSALQWTAVGVVIGGDGDNDCSHLTIAGTNYTYTTTDGNTTLTEGTDSWGRRQSINEVTEGVNLMVVSNASGATGPLTIGGHRVVSGNDVTARGTVAAIQVQLAASTYSTGASLTGLVEGTETTWSEFLKDDTGVHTSFNNSLGIGVTASADAGDSAVLLVDTDAYVNRLDVSGGVLKLAIQQGKTFTLNSLSLSGSADQAHFTGKGKLVLQGDLAFGDTSGANGTKDQVSDFSGLGTLELAEGVTLSIGTGEGSGAQRADSVNLADKVIMRDHSTLSFNATSAEIASGFEMHNATIYIADYPGGKAAEFNGDIELHGGNTINAKWAGSQEYRLNGDISGDGSLSLTKGSNIDVPTYNYLLSGTNTYTGGTTIDSGVVVKATNGSAFGTGSVANSGTIIVDTEASATVSNNITGSGTLTVEGTGAKTFSGTINANTLNTSGGKTTFTNTITATTINTAGTVNISGNIGGADNQQWTIKTGSEVTFTGNRTVGSPNTANSRITVEADATLDASAGRLWSSSDWSNGSMHIYGTLVVKDMAYNGQSFGQFRHDAGALNLYGGSEIVITNGTTQAAKLNGNGDQHGFTLKGTDDATYTLTYRDGANSYMTFMGGLAVDDPSTRTATLKFNTEGTSEVHFTSKTTDGTAESAYSGFAAPGFVIQKTGDGTMYMETYFKGAVEVAGGKFVYDNTRGTDDQKHLTNLKLTSGTAEFKQNATVEALSVSDAAKMDVKSGTVTLSGTVSLGAKGEDGSSDRIKVADGAEMVHDSVTYSKGAVLGNATADNQNFSLLNENVSVTGGKISIAAGQGTVSDRNIGAALNGTDVTYTADGYVAFAGTQRIGALEATQGGRTLYVGGTRDNRTAESNVTVDSISGFSTITVENVTVAGTEKKSSFTVNNLGTVKQNGGTAAKIEGAALAGSTDSSNASIAGTSTTELAKMTTLSLDAAVDIDIRNATLYDSTINAGSHSITYSVEDGSRVKAVAATATETGTQLQARAFGPAASGDLEGGNSATAVQTGGSASGKLTVDVDKALLTANPGKTLEWTIFSGVDIAAGFVLDLGDILSTIVDNGKPVVSLKVNDGEAVAIKAADISTPGYNLLAIPEDGMQNATVVLIMENIPEPATGTLSVLALAALAARRRRGKKN